MRGKRNLRAVLLVASVPGLVGILLTWWPPTAGLERQGLDLLFELRGPLPQPQGVAVVAIDAESREVWEVDPSAPWPRALHGELVRTLHAEGARAVAFDVLFEDARDPVDDAIFAEEMKKAKFVVLGATVEQVGDPKFRLARQVDPWKPFADAAAAVAEVNLPTDRDGVIRMTWLTHGVRPSLALAAYEVATGKRTTKADSGAAIGETAGPPAGEAAAVTTDDTPVDPSLYDGRSRMIDYYGPPRTVPTVSLYQALQPEEYLPPGYFHDRIVFVGLAEVAAIGDEAKDSWLTPYRGPGLTTYGVEIHATVAANLLDGRRILLLDRRLEAAGMLVLPLIAALIFIQARPLLGGVALIVLEIVPIAAAWAVFVGRGLWIPVVIPALVQLPLAYLISILWYYLTTVRDRERIRKAFSFYLSPAMTNRIAEDPDSLNLGGEEIVATALFSDIKGFTSIAENQSAPETAAMLNEYFSEITRDIFEADGTLIKYIGDAVFAIWGAPIYMEDHATLACRTALAMSQAQQRLAGTAAAQLVTRIGVHTGPMLVGNLGSKQRFDYTAIGDAVNLAARLEGLNKAFGTFTLASEDSFSRTDGSVLGRSLGRARVVGRSEPVEIFELVGLTGEPTRPDARGLELFAGALRAYAARHFDEAERDLGEVIRICGGHDGPSEFYLERIAELRTTPPGEDWDAVIQFTKK